MASGGRGRLRVKPKGRLFPDGGRGSRNVFAPPPDKASKATLRNRKFTSTPWPRASGVMTSTSLAG